MIKNRLLERIHQNRLIAAVKEEKYLEKALEANVKVVFLLIGNITTAKRYIDLFKSHDFLIFLHVEKIEGLQCDRAGLEYVSNIIQPDGIISTKNSVIKQAKKMNLLTIQRLFLIDTDAVKNGLLSIAENQPDAVEIMPARIPQLIQKIKNHTNIPVITGGLIENRVQMIDALMHGAMAVSTGKAELWKENLLLEDS